jgi:hypothetical protein
LSRDYTILRSSGVWENGEFIKNGTPSTLQFHGIITVATERDLQKVPEGNRQTGAMKILSTEPIYVTGQLEENGFSDVLVWNNEKYQIVAVFPDKDYGFYRGICTRLSGEVV